MSWKISLKCLQIANVATLLQRFILSAGQLKYPRATGISLRDSLMDRITV